MSYGNLGVVDEWGIELGSSVALTRALTFSCAATPGTTSPSGRTSRTDPLFHNTPEHKGTVALEYAGRQGITLGVDARIVDWVPLDARACGTGISRRVRVVNLHAGYRINPHVRVYAIGTNILDQQHFEIYGGSVNGRRVLAGVTTTF